MKSFLNFIRKNGLYAFINLFGLTVSLAFILLLAVFVDRQLTTDAFQKNADRIYLYANENFIGSAYYPRSTFWIISPRWRRLPRISRPPVCPASES